MKKELAQIQDTFLNVIDHLGGKELAIRIAKVRSGIKREKIIDYGERKRKGFLRRLMEEMMR